MIKAIKKLLPAKTKTKFKKLIFKFLFGYDEPGFSFSSCGEDSIINYLFGYKNKGFFIDVGAFHPTKMSNSFAFYCNGWRGINIDAFPGSMEPFKKMRPEDINIEIGISDNPGKMPYYSVKSSHSPMNSFSKEFLQQLSVLDMEIFEFSIETKTLTEILNNYVPLKTEIDVLFIDVEGFELNVLKSNDWIKYRPKVIMSEHHKPLSLEIYETNVVKYLNSQGYTLICKTPNEIIFLENQLRLSTVGQIELN